MRPREYQQKAIESVLKDFRSGVPITLLVAATGLGKTRTAAWIAKELMDQGRIMVIGHRDELLRQSERAFREICGVRPVFEKADQYSPEDGVYVKPPIVISSVQTQNSGDDELRRMQRFNPDEFAFLWIDEADLALAKTWIRVIEHYRQNPDLRVLLVTATPIRADGRGLAEICEHVSFSYGVTQAIPDGWLVPVRSKRVMIDGLDFSHIRTVGGDLDQQQLSVEMMAEKPLHGVANATIEAMYSLPVGTLNEFALIESESDRIAKLAERVKGIDPLLTLGFTVRIDQAMRLSEICNRWIPGISWHVSSETNQDERDKTFKNFADAKLKLLFNVGICTRGYDNPNIEMIVMGRPTKSANLAMQMYGRGTRPHEEIAGLLGDCTEAAERREIIAKSKKPFVTILDLVGMTGQHKLISPIDILGESKPERVIERAKEIIEDGEDTQSALDRATKEIEEEEEASQLLGELEAEKLDAEDNYAITAAAMRRMSIVATADYRVKTVSAFDNKVESPQVSFNRASAKTIDALVAMGVSKETALQCTQKKAGAILSQKRQSGTAEWQKRALARDGYSDGEIRSLNYYQAMEILYPE